MYRKLNKKLKLLEEYVHYPNEGGCAIVAYAITEYIKQIDPTIHTEIVYLFCDHATHNSYENIVNGIPDSCSHAVASINGEYYDTLGKCSIDYLNTNYPNAKKVPINTKLVLKSINKPYIWNNRFNRHSEVPKIFEIMELPEKDICKIEIF